MILLSKTPTVISLPGINSSNIPILLLEKKSFNLLTSSLLFLIKRTSILEPPSIGFNTRGKGIFNVNLVFFSIIIPLGQGIPKLLNIIFEKYLFIAIEDVNAPECV